MDRRSFLSGLALLLSGCMPKSSALTVGSKNFTEQLVLGELLAQYLGRFTIVPVDRRFYLAGTYICHQALLAGRIDMYVEYTGTALVAILKEKPRFRSCRGLQYRARSLLATIRLGSPAFARLR